MIHVKHILSGVDAVHPPPGTRWWPVVVGVLTAVFLLTKDVNRETVAVTVCVAALCYLSAAALRRPWAAWAAVAGGGLLVVASELAGLCWWWGLAAAGAVLLVVGLVGRAPGSTLAAQALAAVGYGVPAVAALSLPGRSGAVLVGVVLAAHAAWDAAHHRRRRVVPRSLAECCMALDLLLGAGFVALAVTG